MTSFWADSGGIEPASSPWQREILPFDLSAFSFVWIHNMSQYTVCPHNRHEYIYICLEHICAVWPETLFVLSPNFLLI